MISWGSSQVRKRPAVLHVAKTAKRFASRLCTRLQGRRYRSLVRRLIPGRICCRVANAKDVPFVSRLYGPLSRGLQLCDFEDLEGHGYALVACVGGKLAGAAIIKRDLEKTAHWWLSRVIVARRYRRLGVGEALVRLAVQEATVRGADRLKLKVYERNEKALRLYRKMGFDTDCASRTRLEHGESVIEMSLPFAPETFPDLENLSATRA